MLEYNGRRIHSGNNYRAIVKPVMIVGRNTSFTTVADLWPIGTAITGAFSIQAAAAIAVASPAVAGGIIINGLLAQVAVA